MEWSDIWTLLVNIAVFACVATLALRSRWKVLEDRHSHMNATKLQSTFSATNARERPGSIITRQNHVIVVCLTGGPCAGKTSVISKILSLAQEYNIQVYYHGETMNLIKNGGFTLKFNTLADSQKISFVTTLVKLQMRTENVLISLASSSAKKALVIVERGLLDFKPLLGDELWQGMLDENYWKEVSLSDNRYHMVIHLETAASGAPEVFERWTAGEWTEQTAIDMDVKLKDAWKNHHNFRALRNMSGMKDFEKKVEEAIKDIVAYVSPSSIRQHKRKYLVECDEPKSWGIPNLTRYEIDTALLRPSTKEMSMEKVESRKNMNGDVLFLQKISVQPDPDSRSVTTHRNVLTPREYLSCVTRAQSKESVHKTRYACIYKTHHYTLTKYRGKREWILRVLTRDQEAAIEVPQFVRMIRLLGEREKVSLEMLHDAEEPPVTEEPPVEKIDTEPKSDSEELSPEANAGTTEEKVPVLDKPADSPVTEPPQA